MLSLDGVLAGGLGFSDCRDHRRARVLGESFEHGQPPSGRPRAGPSRRACFLWTAWRVTPSASAICAQDQPSAYGLPDSRVFDAICHAPQGADSSQCIGGIIGNIDVNDHPVNLS